MSAWFAVMGACCLIASGIAFVVRGRVGLPGTREMGAGLLLVGLGIGLGSLRVAEGWTGTTQHAIGLVSLVCVVPGMAVTSWATWLSRAARRSSTSA